MYEQLGTVHSSSPSNEARLVQAVHANDYSSVAAILYNGEIDLTAAAGEQAVYAACDHESTPILLLLLRSGLVTDRLLCTACARAALRDQYTVTSLLYTMILGRIIAGDADLDRCLTKALRAQAIPSQQYNACTRLVYALDGTDAPPPPLAQQLAEFADACPLTQRQSVEGVLADFLAWTPYTPPYDTTALRRCITELLVAAETGSEASDSDQYEYDGFIVPDDDTVLLKTRKRRRVPALMDDAAAVD